MKKIIFLIIIFMCLANVSCKLEHSFKEFLIEFYQEPAVWKEYTCKIHSVKKYKRFVRINLEIDDEIFKACMINETFEKLESKNILVNGNDNIYIFTLCDTFFESDKNNVDPHEFPICGIKDLEGNVLLDVDEGLEDLLDFIKTSDNDVIS